MVAEVLATVGVDEERIERCVVSGICKECRGMVRGALRMAQKSRRQLTARGRIGRLRHGIADVGDHRTTPTFRAHAYPRAPGLQIASGGDARHVGPNTKWGSRAGVELVPVAGHEQPPTGMDFPGDGNQAHGGILGLRAVEKQLVQSQAVLRLPGFTPSAHP